MSKGQHVNVEGGSETCRMLEKRVTGHSVAKAIHECGETSTSSVRRSTPTNLSGRTVALNDLTVTVRGWE